MRKREGEKREVGEGKEGRDNGKRGYWFISSHTINILTIVITESCRHD